MPPKKKVDYGARASKTVAGKQSYGSKDFGWIEKARYGKRITQRESNWSPYRDLRNTARNIGKGAVAGLATTPLIGSGAPVIGAVAGFMGSFAFGGFGSKRRDYERALDDYVRGVQTKGSNINRQIWKRVMTGEYSIGDFKKLVVDSYNPYAATYTGTPYSALAGQKEGIGGDFGQGGWDRLSGTWGRFGGFDVKQFMQFQENERRATRKREEKQLQPGLQKQTGNIFGINRGAAKATLLGKY